MNGIRWMDEWRKSDGAKSDGAGVAFDPPAPLVAVPPGAWLRVHPVLSLFFFISLSLSQQNEDMTFLSSQYHIKRQTGSSDSVGKSLFSKYHCRTRLRGVGFSAVPFRRSGAFTDSNYCVCSYSPRLSVPRFLQSLF